MLTKVPVITKKGREKLGKVLKFHREALALSMDKFVIEIEKTTGRSVSKAAISDLERGNTEPKWDTLAINDSHYWCNDWILCGSAVYRDDLPQ